MDAKPESLARHHRTCLHYFLLNNARLCHSSKDKTLRERGAMEAIGSQESRVKTTQPKCDIADPDAAEPRITSSCFSRDCETDSRFEEASGRLARCSRGHCDGDTRLHRRGRQWLDSAEERKVCLTPTYQPFVFLPKSCSLPSLPEDVKESSYIYMSA